MSLREKKACIPNIIPTVPCINSKSAVGAGQGDSTSLECGYLA